MKSKNLLFVLLIALSCVLVSCAEPESRPWELSGNYYATLQEAINAVPTSSTDKNVSVAKESDDYDEIEAYWINLKRDTRETSFVIDNRDDIGIDFGKYTYIVSGTGTIKNATVYFAADENISAEQSFYGNISVGNGGELNDYSTINKYEQSVSESGTGVAKKVKKKQYTKDTERWNVFFYIDMADLNALADLNNMVKGTINNPTDNLRVFIKTGSNSMTSDSDYWDPWKLYNKKDMYPYLVQALTNAGYTTDTTFEGSLGFDNYQYWLYSTVSSGSDLIWALQLSSDTDYSDFVSKGMDEGTELTKFINSAYSYCKNNKSISYSDKTTKTDKYILQLWDHGGNGLRGMIWDYTTDTDSKPCMSIQDFIDSTTSSDFCKDDNGKKKFELTIFDMCLMMGIENLNVCKHISKSVAGSETTSVASGYEEFFKFLNENPSATYRDAAEAFVVAADNSQKPDKENVNEDRTWSAFDLTDENKINALNKAFDDFMKVVSDTNITSTTDAEYDEDNDDNNSYFYPLITNSIDDSCGNWHDPDEGGDVFDIVNAAQWLEYDTEDLEKAINDIMIANRYGEYYEGVEENYGGLPCGLTFVFYSQPYNLEPYDGEDSVNSAYEAYLNRIESWSENFKNFLEKYY